MSHTPYQSVDPSPSFDEMERSILNYWQQNDIFKKSVMKEDAKGNFIFYDGPPFASGLPHYGHLLTSYVKDTVARYQTQLGNKVERRFGWDCHGLPAELIAEKNLGISGRQDILKIGIDKFNNECKSTVLKYTDQWEEYITRQGRWVDFKNDYKTMDKNFMESVLWAFAELYKKGLVYKSYRVMPYSWACETPLSNFETKLDNSYRERADKSITVKFKLNTLPPQLKGEVKNCYLLAWTTTPWTLPANLALAVNHELKYVYIIKGDDCYILAKSGISKYQNELGDGELKGEFDIHTIVGKSYEPLFDFFSDHPNAFKVLNGNFVLDGEGTGIVHMAPGFGEDDQMLCEKNNIELVCPVDSRGRYTEEVKSYKGKQVFEANDQIIIDLKQKGLWLKTEQYIHNYPHCWRTDTPLIYKAVSSWYIEVTKIKERMVQLNQEINWIPAHIKDGQFGKWLENARDWSISRNRFWGTPIPIWESDDPTYPRIEVYGSIKELEEAFGVKVEDLHLPFIDTLVRANPDDPTGKSMMRRVPDVFDCWFESGSMPYAQNHYPFENQEIFEANFPADFIVEYVAQTRAWFYTLMILSTALFDRPPFKNCICHGVILDISGQKLSKRLNNYANPLDILKTYGSDALRFFMLSSHVLKGNDMLIDKDANVVKDVLRLTIKPLWSAYNFFVLYANADKLNVEYKTDSSNLLDRYILSKLKEATGKISIAMNSYEIAAACEGINEFLDVLNNWYIRRNRNRFWKEEKDADKFAAYSTLGYVLLNFVKASASLLPFISEEIYMGLLNLDKNKFSGSVHLDKFPVLEEIQFDEKLIAEMDQVQIICSTALSIRNQQNLKIRQPLASITVYGKNPEFLGNYQDIIKDELNIKELIISDQIEQVADYKLKLNYKNIGKRLPAKVKEIIAAAGKMDWQINSSGLVIIANTELRSDEFELLISSKDNNAAAATPNNDILITLDTNITPALKAEGLTRDLVRMIQQARKDSGLLVSDHINLIVSSTIDFNSQVQNFIPYIEEQTLSKVTFVNEESAGDHFFSTKIEEFEVQIWFTKIKV